MEQQPNKFLHWIKTSTTARMMMIGFLSIIMMLPLSYIEDLIQERSLRQETVVNEIGKQWGNEVVIYGPILKVPYKVFLEKMITDEITKKVTTEKIEQVKVAYFFPEKLAINSTINPEQKNEEFIPQQYLTAKFFLMAFLIL